MNILVSACLLGVKCRYDGKGDLREMLETLIDRHNLVPFCPEVYGGLSTPRMPSERLGNRVIDHAGTDVTENFVKGAEAALHIARFYNCRYAILKDKSPSCGKDMIYDGTFNGRLVEGNGVTAELLMQNGIEVIRASETEKIKELFMK